jgi:hypothetical protein
MATLSVQVDPLLADRCRNEDLRPVRRVEAEEVAVAVCRAALDQLDDVTVLGGGVVAD